MKFLLLPVFLFIPLAGDCQSPYIDSLQQTLRELPGIEQVGQLHELAFDRLDYNVEDARKVAEMALSHASSLENDTLIYKSYLVAGDVAVRIPDAAYADSMFQIALVLAQKRNNIPHELKAKDNLSRSYARQGKYDESNVLLDEIIQSSEAYGDSLVWARAIMTKGMNYEKQSAYDLAIQHYYKALAIHQLRGDQFRVGIVHNNIGMTLQKSKRYPQALVEFEKALIISEAEPDTEGIMIYTLNIGVVHQKMSQYEKAKEYFNKSLAIAKELNSWVDIAILNGNLGGVAMQQGKNQEALPLILRAIEIKDSLGLEHELAHSTNSLAQVYFNLKDYPRALQAANESVRISTKYESRDQLSEAHRLLSEIYAAQNQFTLAFEHLQKHKTLSDSIYFAERDQTVSQLHIQHGTALKESQISELTEKQQRIKRDKLIYLGIALLLLITAASIIYALYQRRSRDRNAIESERLLHERQNQFFANISHEFRTPLTLILGPVHQLRAKFKGTKEDSLLKPVQQSAERLLQLINQILDIAKFDMKVLELKKETFNATVMIEGIASSFDTMARDRKITYTYSCEPHLLLHGDKQRLEIVLSNLISNAFKFTPEDGRISIIAHTDQTKQRLIVEVSDSGSGISKENLSKVFDRYYHDDRQAHSDFEGAGIGLALCKLISEMHGGSITVKSQLEQGTTFTMNIPYDPELKTATIGTLDATRTLENAIVIDHQVEAGTNTQGDFPIVLLVEDRKDMRDYIVSVLSNHYRVIESSNANDGWNKAIEHTPDIIISDVMMPGKSGLEFCREIKQDMRTSHIPVMLLTAKSSQEDRLTGLETQADVYLTKPFIPHELELHLRNLLASRKTLSDFYAHHRQIEPASMAFNSVDEQFLAQFIKHLDAHFKEEAFGVEQLAELMNLSRSQVHRKLTALTGQVPNRLIRTYRLKRAHDMVSQNAATISEIAFGVGFSSPAYFTKCFVEEYGITPHELRSRHINI